MPYVNPALPYLPGYVETSPLRPTDQHPFAIDSYTILGVPGPPTDDMSASFLPDIYRNPYIDGMTAATQIGSYAAANIPAAAQFHAELYGPEPMQVEQTFMQAASSLGMRGLEEAFRRIDTQYETAPMHSSRVSDYADAALAYADQMMQHGSTLGIGRIQKATEVIHHTYQIPMLAAQANQTFTEGLYSIANNAKFGDLQQAMAFYTGYPLLSPVAVQSGGGKG